MQRYEQNPRIIQPDDYESSTDLVSLPAGVQNQLLCAQGLDGLGRRHDASLHRIVAADQLALTDPRRYSLLEAADRGFPSILEEQMNTRMIERRVECRFLGVKYHDRREWYVDRSNSSHAMQLLRERR